jgi:glutaminase
MYDYSGNWAYDIGVPAKSGVGGGIVGVANRQLGIGTLAGWRPFELFLSV